MEQKTRFLEKNIIGIDCGFSVNNNIFVMYSHKNKFCSLSLKNICRNEVMKFCDAQSNLKESDMSERIKSFMEFNYGGDLQISKKIFIMENCVLDWTRKLPKNSILRSEEYKKVAKFCIAMQKAFINRYSSQIIYVDHRDTSNICSNCSFKNKENAKNIGNTSGKKTFECLRCLHTCNRDENAAKNIFFRGVEKLMKLDNYSFNLYEE